MYRCHKSWGDTCVACPLLLSFSFLVPRREREGRRWSRVWRWSSTRTCTAHARAGRGRHQMSGRPGCRRGWAARTGQQRRTVCGNIPCPRDKRGPFALAAGWSGRPGCRRGWAATMSVLISASPTGKKIGQLLYLRAATALWLHATHRPLGARLSRGRATTSSKERGCRAEVVTRPRDNLPYGRRRRRRRRRRRKVYSRPTQ